MKSFGKNESSTSSHLQILYHQTSVQVSYTIGIEIPTVKRKTNRQSRADTKHEAEGTQQQLVTSYNNHHIRFANKNKTPRQAYAQKGYMNLTKIAQSVCQLQTNLSRNNLKHSLKI